MYHIVLYCCLDFAVSAPYESSSRSTQNRGAIYIYYGRDTKEELGNQTPQKVIVTHNVSMCQEKWLATCMCVQIHADSIVESMENPMLLRTFGFSLSGNVDVDNNQYNGMHNCIVLSKSKLLSQIWWLDLTWIKQLWC